MSTIYLAQWDDLMVVQKLQRDLNRRGVTEVDVLQHFESLNPLELVAEHVATCGLFLTKDFHPSATTKFLSCIFEQLR
jgi:hypothetical protein